MNRTKFLAAAALLLSLYLPMLTGGCGVGPEAKKQVQLSELRAERMAQLVDEAQRGVRPIAINELYEYVRATREMFSALREAMGLERIKTGTYGR